MKISSSYACVDCGVEMSTRAIAVTSPQPPPPNATPLYAIQSLHPKPTSANNPELRTRGVAEASNQIKESNQIEEMPLLELLPYQTEYIIHISEHLHLPY